jgi:hypothetical protein
MKHKLLLCLALFLCDSLFASLVTTHYSGYGKMAAAADLVAKGVVTNVQDLDETNSIAFNGTEVKLRGVETTFKISKVIKGQLATNTIILHHYRLDQKKSNNTPRVFNFTPKNFDKMVINNGYTISQGLIKFTPNPTNTFDLYLVKDGVNRFAPASGQLDAAFSIHLEAPSWDSSYNHEADPSIREQYQILVPTKLSVKQIQGVLRIQTDKQSIEATNLTIGTNMSVGIWCDVYVYAGGVPRPTNYCHSLQPDVGVFSPNASEENKLEFDPFTYYWRPDENGLAQPNWSLQPWVRKHEGSVVAGTKYNVEMDLTLFETDSTRNIDHYWNPKSARYYKILWQRTLKQAF